jgi:hypothetical protein
MRKRQVGERPEQSCLETNLVRQSFWATNQEGNFALAAGGQIRHPSG